MNHHHSYSILCNTKVCTEIHTSVLHTHDGKLQSTIVIWDLIVADLCNPFDLYAKQTMEMPMHSSSGSCIVCMVCVFAYGYNGIWLRLLDNSWVEPTESLLSYLYFILHFDESLGFPVLHCVPSETDLWDSRITFEAQGIQFNMIVR